MRSVHAQATCDALFLPDRPFRRVQAGADAAEQRREEAGCGLQLLLAQKFKTVSQRSCHVRLLLHRQPLDALLRSPALRSTWQIAFVSNAAHMHMDRLPTKRRM